MNTQKGEPEWALAPGKGSLWGTRCQDPSLRVISWGRRKRHISKCGWLVYLGGNVGMLLLFP